MTAARRKGIGGARAALLVATLALAGCGMPAADLFVVERSGTIPGARLTLLVGDGGTVRCNGGPEHEITGAQLIAARAVARELNGDAERPGPARSGLALAVGPGSVLRYSVRSEAGAVRFSDTSPGQPPVLYRVAKLTRDLARGPCGLAR